MRMHSVNEQEEGRTDLSGTETSVKGLVTLWVNVRLIDGETGRVGGSLFDIDQLLF